MAKAHWMLSLQTASLILMRILRFSHIDSHTQEHMPMVDCVLLPLQCSWKQQMHELMNPDFTSTNLTLPHMNYILWAWKTNPPQTLPCVPVLFNYAERTEYMLSLWCCPGGCWQVAYELIWETKGTFCSYCGSPWSRITPKHHHIQTTTFSTTTASISWLISIQFSSKT